MTTFSYVFDEFLDKITDPELLMLSENILDETLAALLRKAVARVQRDFLPSVDLSVLATEESFNEETGKTETVTIDAFEADLPYEVIDILTEWMVAYWLKPYVNNLENLRNNLNTKDFTSFSPANLLEKVGDRYTAARRYARSLSNEYSMVINDLTTLTTSKRR